MKKRKTEKRVSKLNPLFFNVLLKYASFYYSFIFLNLKKKHTQILLLFTKTVAFADYTILHVLKCLCVCLHSKYSDHSPITQMHLYTKTQSHVIVIGLKFGFEKLKKVSNQQNEKFNRYLFTSFIFMKTDSSLLYKIHSSKYYVMRSNVESSI